MTAASILYPRPVEISILMTGYNSAKFLDEAIESILNQQTKRSWELIFADDGSADHTLSIARGYARHFPDKVRIFTHPQWSEPRHQRFAESCSAKCARTSARIP